MLFGMVVLLGTEAARHRDGGDRSSWNDGGSDLVSSFAVFAAAQNQYIQTEDLRFVQTPPTSMDAAQTNCGAVWSNSSLVGLNVASESTALLQIITRYLNDNKATLASDAPGVGGDTHISFLLAGTDQALASTWRWKYGRYAGNVFFTSGSGCVIGSYCNWEFGFPALGTSERCMMLRGPRPPSTTTNTSTWLSFNAKWRTVSCTTPNVPYICRRYRCVANQDCVGTQTESATGYVGSCTCKCRPGFRGSLCQFIKTRSPTFTLTPNTTRTMTPTSSHPQTSSHVLTPTAEQSVSNGSISVSATVAVSSPSSTPSTTPALSTTRTRPVTTSVTITATGTVSPGTPSSSATSSVSLTTSSTITLTATLSRRTFSVSPGTPSSSPSVSRAPPETATATLSGSSSSSHSHSVTPSGTNPTETPNTPSTARSATVTAGRSPTAVISATRATPTSSASGGTPTATSASVSMTPSVSPSLTLSPSAPSLTLSPSVSNTSVRNERYRTNTSEPTETIVMTETGTGVVTPEPTATSTRLQTPTPTTTPTMVPTDTVTVDATPSPLPTNTLTGSSTLSHALTTATPTITRSLTVTSSVSATSSVGSQTQTVTRSPPSTSASASPSPGTPTTTHTIARTTASLTASPTPSPPTPTPTATTTVSPSGGTISGTESEPQTASASYHPKPTVSGELTTSLAVSDSLPSASRSPSAASPTLSASPERSTHTPSSSHSTSVSTSKSASITVTRSPHSASLSAPLSSFTVTKMATSSFTAFTAADRTITTQPAPTPTPMHTPTDPTDSQSATLSGSRTNTHPSPSETSSATASGSDTTTFSSSDSRSLTPHSATRSRSPLSPTQTSTSTVTTSQSLSVSVVPPLTLTHTLSPTAAHSTSASAVRTPSRGSVTPSNTTAVTDTPSANISRSVPTVTASSTLTVTPSPGTATPTHSMSVVSVTASATRALTETPRDETLDYHGPPFEQLQPSLAALWVPGLVQCRSTSNWSAVDLLSGLDDRQRQQRQADAIGAVACCVSFLHAADRVKRRPGASSAYTHAAVTALSKLNEGLGSAEEGGSGGGCIPAAECIAMLANSEDNSGHQNALNDRRRAASRLQWAMRLMRALSPFALGPHPLWVVTGSVAAIFLATLLQGALGTALFRFLRGDFYSWPQCFAGVGGCGIGLSWTLTSATSGVGLALASLYMFAASRPAASTSSSSSSSAASWWEPNLPLSPLVLTNTTITATLAAARTATDPGGYLPAPVLWAVAALFLQTTSPSPPPPSPSENSMAAWALLGPIAPDRWPSSGVGGQGLWMAGTILVALLCPLLAFVAARSWAAPRRFYGASIDERTYGGPPLCGWACRKRCCCRRLPQPPGTRPNQPFYVGPVSDSDNEIRLEHARMRRLEARAIREYRDFTAPSHARLVVTVRFRRFCRRLWRAVTARGYVGPVAVRRVWGPLIAPYRLPSALWSTLPLWSGLITDIALLAASPVIVSLSEAAAASPAQDLSCMAIVIAAAAAHYGLALALLFWKQPLRSPAANVVAAAALAVTGLHLLVHGLVVGRVAFFSSPQALLWSQFEAWAALVPTLARVQQSQLPAPVGSLNSTSLVTANQTLNFLPAPLYHDNSEAYAAAEGLITLNNMLLTAHTAVVAVRLAAAFLPLAFGDLCLTPGLRGIPNRPNECVSGPAQQAEEVRAEIGWAVAAGMTGAAAQLLRELTAHFSKQRSSSSDLNAATTDTNTSSLAVGLLPAEAPRRHQKGERRAAREKKRNRNTSEKGKGGKGDRVEKKGDGDDGSGGGSREDHRRVQKLRARGQLPPPPQWEALPGLAPLDVLRAAAAALFGPPATEATDATDENLRGRASTIHRVGSFAMEDGSAMITLPSASGFQSPSPHRRSLFFGGGGGGGGSPTSAGRRTHSVFGTTPSSSTRRGDADAATAPTATPSRQQPLSSSPSSYQRNAHIDDVLATTRGVLRRGSVMHHRPQQPPPPQEHQKEKEKKAAGTTKGGGGAARNSSWSDMELFEMDDLDAIEQAAPTRASSKASATTRRQRGKSQRTFSLFEEYPPERGTESHDHSGSNNKSNKSPRGAGQSIATPPASASPKGRSRSLFGRFASLIGGSVDSDDDRRARGNDSFNFDENAAVVVVVNDTKNNHNNNNNNSHDASSTSTSNRNTSPTSHAQRRQCASSRSPMTAQGPLPPPPRPAVMTGTRQRGKSQRTLSLFEEYPPQTAPGSPNQKNSGNVKNTTTAAGTTTAPSRAPSGKGSSRGQGQSQPQKEDAALAGQRDRQGRTYSLFEEFPPAAAPPAAASAAQQQQKKTKGEEELHPQAAATSAAAKPKASSPRRAPSSSTVPAPSGKKSPASAMATKATTSIPRSTGDHTDDGDDNDDDDLLERILMGGGSAASAPTTSATVTALANRTPKATATGDGKQKVVKDTTTGTARGSSNSSSALASAPVASTAVPRRNNPPPTTAAPPPQQQQRQKKASSSSRQQWSTSGGRRADSVFALLEDDGGEAPSGGGAL